MAPLGSLAHLLEPEPSFADQLVRLESLYPVHPLFLPIDGGPFDSDEEQELLAKQDAARGLSCARARVAPTKKVHARPPPPPPPKRKARRLPTSPPEPPGPAAQSHRLEQPASSASDEQAMVSSDERTSSSSDEEDAAAAGPTSPPGRPAKRPRDVVELSTDADADEDDEVMVEASSPPIRRQGTAVRAATGAELRRRLRAAARAAAPVEQEGAPKGRGRSAKKARLSRTLDQAVDDANKLNRQKLLAQFSTIATFVDHLAEFERAPTTRPRILDGCRIVFINTDDWTNTAPRKNRFVEALRLNMGIAARNGATLVKPDEFVPPPFDVSDDKVATASDTLATRAETEQWTTHVIPLEPAQGRHKLSYDKVLSCLGTASGGIGPDELGPYVKVVQFKWISACVNARARVDEGEFVLPGDYREGARRLQERERALEAELRRKAKARERERRKERQQEDPSRSRRPGARDADGDADEDTQRESDVEDDEPMDGVSCVDLRSVIARRRSALTSFRRCAARSAPTTGPKARRQHRATLICHARSRPPPRLSPSAPRARTSSPRSAAVAPRTRATRSMIRTALACTAPVGATTPTRPRREGCRRACSSTKASRRRTTSSRRSAPRRSTS